MTRLVALWFALLAADRLDLLAGGGPFVVTPFLLLTPALCVHALRQRPVHHHPMNLGGRALLLLMLLLLLLAFVTASVFASMELSRSAMRAMQLVAVAFGTVAVRLLVPADQLAAGLVRGAEWGVRWYGAVCLLQLLALPGVLPAALPSESLPMMSLLPSLHGGLVPRLSGPVVDSNRSGLILFMYIAVLLRHDWRRHVGTVAWALFFLLLTLSRSSLLAAMGALAWTVGHQPLDQLLRRLVTPVSSRPSTAASLRATRALAAVGVAATLLVVGVALPLLVAPTWRAESAQLLGPLAERFSISQGSGDDHLRLLVRGVATATRSLPTALQGIGYGSSYLVLQDFFPGDRYGNFHSIYVGIFAESGVFALLALLLLLGVPLALRTSQAALALAVAVFGVFYTALPEPTFWLAVVLAWLPVSLAAVTSARPKATSSATAIASTAPSAS
jgi:hypothetical protein